MSILDLVCFVLISVSRDVTRSCIVNFVYVIIALTTLYPLYYFMSHISSIHLQLTECIVTIAKLHSLTHSLTHTVCVCCSCTFTCISLSLASINPVTRMQVDIRTKTTSNTTTSTLTNCIHYSPHCDAPSGKCIQEKEKKKKKRKESINESQVSTNDE